MSTIATLSTMVTGFPARLRQPKPLPGETLVHLVIRNRPQQWRNFVARLEADFSIPKNVRDRLLSGRLNSPDLDSLGPKVEEQLEEFINNCLPTHGRTLKSLANLQHQMKDPFSQQVNGFTLIEIICPRQRNPYDSNEDRSFEQFASKMGAKVIWTPHDAPRIFNLATILSHIHGDFIWLVPGGTQFASSLVIPSLRRVLGHLVASSKCAFYTDNADSIIYRTSSLHELARRGKDLSANSRDMARMLQEAGYEFAVDNDPASILCELEKEYGGRGLGG